MDDTKARFPWSEPEEWAWKKIRSGERADFNARQDGKFTVAPDEAERDEAEAKRRHPKRTISGRFLRQILLEKPYRDQIPFFGVQITGAYFPDKIDLAHGRSERQLWLENCRFAQEVDLSGLKIDEWFSLDGSYFINQNNTAPAINFQGANITGHVSLQGSHVTGEIDFKSAKINGTLALDGATVTGTLNMDSIDVGKHLLLRSTDEAPAANFQEVNLSAAKIGGLLDLSGATVAKKLEMGSVHVGQHLMMNSTSETHRATFQEISLSAASIDGILDLTGATVTGDLYMDGLQVGRDLRMIDAQVSSEKPITLTFASIKTKLDLSGCEFTHLDLSGTRIDGQLLLGRIRSVGKTVKRTLELGNTSVGVVQDVWDEKIWKHGRGPDAWPEVLQLDGFSYDRLGGASEDPKLAMAERPIDWYIGWLERDNPYSPQPYEYLASVFKKTGRPVKANAILFASRQRARRDAEFWRGLGLFVLEVTMGYGLGLRYFRSLGWALLLTVVGYFVLCYSGAGPDAALDKVAYSLSQLLPVLSLTKPKLTTPLSGWVEAYFMLHQLVGYALASFVVAGMGGLTQKS